MNKRDDITNGFTLNMCTRVPMPDVEYINELAVEKNFALGKSFQNPPKLLEDLYFLFRKENADPYGFELKNHIFSRQYLKDDILFRDLTPEENAYYKSTLLFLEKIDFGSVIGVTPLDKALNVMMYLVHLSKKTNPAGNEGGYESTNDPSPGKIEIPDEETLKEAITEMSKAKIGSGKGGDSTVTPPEQQDDEISDDITSCVRDQLGDLTPSIANIYGVKRPSDVPINRRILGDIKIKAYLEDTKGMETSLDSKKIKNNDSAEKERFQMDNHNQITKINKSNMMHANFDDKFIKKELAVKEKVKPEEKKQLLYMLLDDSGSMNCRIKQTYVRAVLLNRLQSVVEDKSELEFALYESERYGFKSVNDKKSAQQLYKDISLRRPQGGGTYIGNILQQTINDIHNKPGFHDPEIMIVCDGDDHVDPDSLDYKDVRINVILLGTTNKNLERIAKETGGFFTMEKLYNRY